MAWFELKIKVGTALQDALSNRLFELGAQGVVEIPSGSDLELQAFFEISEPKGLEKEIKQYCDSLSTLFPSETPSTWTITPVAMEKWGEKYKQFFHAQKLTRYFFLRPAWDEETRTPDGMFPIHMEAGQAFGTGLHATTRLCLRLIEQAVDEMGNDQSMIDVGTGSGILSIGAYILGVKNITAIDVDPVSVETAQENFTRNHCQGIRVSAQAFGTFKKPFSLIVSNILLETHRELIKDYQRLLEPKGILILSGLLGGQRESIIEICAGVGLSPIWSDSFQEWIAVAFYRGEKR